MMYSKLVAPGPLGGNRGVLAMARSLAAAREPFVLAIVVGTQGSTYRKPGALALVIQDGSLEGVISGGCLEATLQETALQVLAAEQPRLLVFDTQSKDDVIFGSGSACRGLMRVLLMPVVPPHTCALYAAIDHAHHDHLRLKFALSISESSLAHGAAWCGDQTLSFGDAGAHLLTLRDAKNGEHVMQRAGAALHAMVFDVPAAPRLLLIGAGPEALPILRVARSLGWFVTLVDHRAAAIASCAMNADHTIVSRPQAALAELATERFDAALIMTHTAAADLEALQALAMRGEPYVGLLGPPARRDELLQQLGEEGTRALQARLRAPVGLRLGGDGPESLALSIVADLQRFFFGPQ